MKNKCDTLDDYCRGFKEKCAEYGVPYEAIAFDLTMTKVAQAALPVYDQLQDTDTRDFDGGYLSNGFDQYYRGPSGTRSQFGPFASNFYDNTTKRRDLFNRVANQLKQMEQVQMAYQARGMKVPQ